jgi:ribosomal-protein-alanine N-acetyltransferase
MPSTIFGSLAAIEKGRKQIVGFCGLRLVEESPSIEVLYGIAREDWGKGLATEAARAVIEDGLDRLRLKRIVGMANPSNVASWRVLQKVGMKYDRQARHNGEDIVFYAISRQPH